MAGSVNKVILIGNLGRDPETRSMTSGAKVVTLNVGTNERWNDRDGNRQERVEWHKVVIFNEKIAEVAEKYLRKGSLVHVEGQLQTRKWTDQAGADRYSTEVVLQRFRGELTLLDKVDTGDRYGSHQQGNRAPASPPASGGGRRDDDLDDDVPF